jgi:hypothetical protein
MLIAKKIKKKSKKNKYRTFCFQLNIIAFFAFEKEHAVMVKKTTK